VEVGVVTSFSHRHFSLQQNLVYAQKGFVLTGGLQETSGTQTSIVSFHEVFRLNYLSIPVNLLYTQKEDGYGFQGFVGAYVSRFLSGRVEFDNYQGVVGATRNVYQAVGAFTSSG
jgi:hypothetical protein